MMADQLTTQTPVPEIRTLSAPNLAGCRHRLEAYLLRTGNIHLSRHPGWLPILKCGMRHVPYCLEAVQGQETVGFLLLAHVHSLLFGRFLVSLPYVNYGGPIADEEAVARRLIDQAVHLADQLGVRYLELRNQEAVAHPALTLSRTDKVHMRLNLPARADLLWDGLSPKVRNQVRKGQKSDLTFVSGGEELLSEYYAVFSENMRDLGTPVFGRGLFWQTLREFRDRAELCVVRAGKQPVAAALLLHGWGVTEVPSASSLREFNHTCANMLLYWHLLERAILRKQNYFDFGRSSKESTTFRFKKQWGAEPVQAEWQYYVRTGEVSAMRQDNPRYRRVIRAWQRLPVWLTRLIGPSVVRGIP